MARVRGVGSARGRIGISDTGGALAHDGLLQEHTREGDGGTRVFRRHLEDRAEAPFGGDRGGGRGRRRWSRRSQARRPRLLAG